MDEKGNWKTQSGNNFVKIFVTVKIVKQWSNILGVMVKSFLLAYNTVLLEVAVVHWLEYELGAESWAADHNLH